MSKSIPEVLTSSAEEVLETMFFTQVVGRGQAAGSSDAEAEKKPYIAVRLCFLGGAEPSASPSTDRPGGHLDIEVSRAGAQLIASSFLAAHAHSMTEMLWTRAAMGLSEAFYIPAALGLLIKVHEERFRSLASGIHQTGCYAGIIAGGTIGGMAEHHHRQSRRHRAFARAEAFKPRC